MKGKLRIKQTRNNVFNIIFSNKLGCFVVISGGLFADRQSRAILTNVGVRLRPPFLFSGVSFVSIGRNNYICSRKTHKDPKNVRFVTNFVTPLNNKVGFLLYFN